VADRNRLVHRRQSIGLGMLPVKHGSPTVPMPGYQVDVVDEAAKSLPAGTMGSIVIKLPMPPACLPTLWEQDERCKEAYFNEFPATTNLRRRLHRRGRLRLCDGPHRRHHQRRRPSASPPAAMEEFWRRIPTSPNARCSASRTPSRARRRALFGAEGGRDAQHGGDRKGNRGAGAGKTRPRCGVSKLAITVARLPKPVGQNPARHHQEDRRWRYLDHAATIEDPKVLEEIQAR